MEFMIPDDVSPSLPTGATRNIVGRIGRRIANGAYPEGTLLPKEEELVAALGESRTTVRNAVKVLTGKGMVRTARRYGTMVRPVSEWNLLDADVIGWHDPSNPRLHAMYRETMELRRLIEPQAAEMAAARASDAMRARICRAAQDMLPEDSDAQERFSADCRFHAAVIDGSGNQMLRHLKPTIFAMIRLAFEFGSTGVRVAKDPRLLHIETAEAIARGDGAAARALMAEMMHPDFLTPLRTPAG